MVPTARDPQITMQAAVCPACHNYYWPLETHGECLFLVLEPPVIVIVLLCVVFPPWELEIGSFRALCQHLMEKIQKNPSPLQKCVQRRVLILDVSQLSSV